MPYPGYIESTPSHEPLISLYIFMNVTKEGLSAEFGANKIIIYNKLNNASNEIIMENI